MFSKEGKVLKAFLLARESPKKHCSEASVFGSFELEALIFD